MAKLKVITPKRAKQARRNRILLIVLTIAFILVVSSVIIYFVVYQSGVDAARQALGQ